MVPMENPSTFWYDVAVMATGVGPRQGHPLRQDLSDEPVKMSERMVVSEINRLQKQFRIATEKRKSYSTNLKQQTQAQE
ncbi:hypothetical protein AAES_56469 [Amazona aestiva]|uniref:Uncharacterized protein n=1 Tax=Amazona aestiva TaxID=12930 RepID=A0A0Q3PRE2_AMAAE|nr:hypothetical protein AAES_56469 [Amazona aestiva]